MTEQEMQDTLRQMIVDWNAATPEQRRVQRYAAKFRADTIGQGEELEPTDENLATVLQTLSIVRPARPEEFPAIRAALAAWKF